MFLFFKNINQNPAIHTLVRIEETVQTMEIHSGVNVPKITKEKHAKVDMCLL